MSTPVNMLRYNPSVLSPQWATRSTSMNLGRFSFHSAKVLMGMAPLSRLPGLVVLNGLLDPLSPWGFIRRSMDDALIALSCSAASGVTFNSSNRRLLPTRPPHLYRSLIAFAYSITLLLLMLLPGSMRRSNDTLLGNIYYEAIRELESRGQSPFLPAQTLIHGSAHALRLHIEASFGISPQSSYSSSPAGASTTAVMLPAASQA